MGSEFITKKKGKAGAATDKKRKRKGIGDGDAGEDTLPIRPKPAKVAKRAAICVPLPESTVAAAYSPPSALELVLVQRPRLRAGRAPLLFWETADGLQLDIAARYPSLGKCRLFTKESFALLEAFESKLAVSEYSRFCYDPSGKGRNGRLGRIFVNHKPYVAAGGRQYGIKLVARSLYQGRRTFHAELDRWITKVNNNTAEENDKTPSNAAIIALVKTYGRHRDRRMALLKEMQYLFAEKVVERTVQKGVSYAPSAREVEAAHHPHASFFDSN